MPKRKPKTQAKKTRKAATTAASSSAASATSAVDACREAENEYVRRRDWLATRNTSLNGMLANGAKPEQATLDAANQLANLAHGITIECAVTYVRDNVTIIARNHMLAQDVVRLVYAWAAERLEPDYAPTETLPEPVEITV